jgi:hypothetical protein
MMKRALIIVISLVGWNAYGTFGEKEMLPMDTQYRECRQGGPSIQCKTEECDAKCSELLKAEQDQKAAERTEILQDVLDDALKVDEQEKNPALFQVK